MKMTRIINWDEEKDRSGARWVEEQRRRYRPKSKDFFNVTQFKALLFVASLISMIFSHQFSSFLPVAVVTLATNKFLNTIILFLL